MKPDTSKVNTNANTTLSQTLYTEPITSSSIKNGAIHGLEIPSLKTGNVDAFIVHSLPDGKLNYCVGYNSSL
ncbi:MAG: hypothetical protein J5733_07015 [Bacteroidaceae bacterium]|nr:hypothetical protein [Bacteroidaceae bacterium]